LNTSMMVKAALIAALMAATSQVAIPQPLSTVPITLQVFFSLLAGAVLGPVYGALSIFVYVLMGAVGLPVFSGGRSGIGILLGPTGGYLLGFIAAAFVVGLIVSKGKGNIIQVTLAMVAGVLVIYALGVMQLAFTANISFSQAIVGGALPFIPFDFIKAVVAVAVARRIGIAVAGRKN